MKRKDGEFTIGPGSELKERFGWTAEKRRPEVLDSDVVPPHLRDLVPLAERWGVTCDVTRHDVAAKSSTEELKGFKVALAGRHDDIVDWLYSFEGTDRPREAAVFQAMLVLELEECGG